MTSKDLHILGDFEYLIQTLWTIRVIYVKFPQHSEKSNLTFEAMTKRHIT